MQQMVDKALGFDRKRLTISGGSQIKRLADDKTLSDEERESQAKGSPSSAMPCSRQPWIASPAEVVARSGVTGLANWRQGTRRPGSRGRRPDKAGRSWPSLPRDQGCFGAIPMAMAVVCTALI